MGQQKVDMGRLRKDTAVRAGYVCEWAQCSERGEEMAHFRAKGIGGNPDQSRNTLTNTVWLCRYHHDVLDRRVTNTTKYEMRILLEGFVKLDRLRWGVHVTDPKGRG
jgi:hypothetical protein